MGCKEPELVRFNYDNSHGINNILIRFSGCTGGRWDTGGNLRGGDYFFYGKGNHEFGTGFLYPTE